MEVILRLAHFGIGRFPGQSGEEEASDVVVILSRIIIGKTGCRAAFGQDLFLDGLGIQHVQTLRQACVHGSFALAGTGRFGASENGQEIVVLIKTVVRQLYRPEGWWQSGEMRAGTGYFINGIQQYFGFQSLRVMT